MKELSNVNENGVDSTLSPDGKFFFYEQDGVIMQIDLSQLLVTN